MIDSLTWLSPFFFFTLYGKVHDRSDWKDLFSCAGNTDKN